MLAKAYLVRRNKPSSIVPFLFNPSQFVVERTNQFSEVNVPGLGSSIFQFVKGSARTLTMDLFFDTYEDKIDVRTYTDLITGWDAGAMFSDMPGIGLMDIDSDLHAPPICLFIWGAFVFPCLIERVTKTFTMFLPEGIPVRATLSVALKECKDYEAQLKEISRQSTDKTKTWLVKESDSLWLLAAKEYGNPDLWRPIAVANNIANPRTLKSGEELIIPPLE